MDSSKFLSFLLIENERQRDYAENMRRGMLTYSL